MEKDRNLFKRGNVYWLRISVGGREFRESLRTTSRKTAQRLRDKRIQQLEKRASSGGLTKLFIEAVVEFSESLEAGNQFSWAAETQKRYLCSIRAIARSFAALAEDNDFDLFTLEVHDVDTKTVSEVVARRKKEVSIATVNRDLTAFNTFMVFCQNKGWIGENPVAEYQRQGMSEELPPITLPNEAAIRRLLKRS